jgi:hypothetical protein
MAENDRKELEELRRIDELERKAAGGKESTKPVAAPIDLSIPTKESLAESEKQAKIRGRKYAAQEPGFFEQVLASPEVPISLVQNIPVSLAGAVATGGKAEPMADFMKKYGYEMKTRGSAAVGEKLGKALEGLPPVLGMGGSVEGAMRTVGPAAKQVAAIPAVQKTAGATQALAKTLGAGAAYPFKRGAEALVGQTTPSVEQLARNLESRGYVFEPRQLRGEKPLGSPGYDKPTMKKNQTLANEDATAATGRKAGFGQVTREHLKKTQDELGKKYNEIFGTQESPKGIKIDSTLAEVAKKAAEFEAAVDPAKVTGIAKTADNISRRWSEIESLNQRLAAYKKKPVVPLSEPPPISASMRRQWSNLVEATAKNAPEHASEIQKTLDELSKNLNLAVKPKVWFGNDRSGSTYGMASGDGHIVIRGGMDRDAAVATALHEFGHQAEFQLLIHAPANVQAEIYKAFQQHRKDVRMGTKTVEQYRPITAAKYSEQTRTQIPSQSYERDYLRNFSEWFAEQTSRWITTTKQPTTVVEKFFAKIADSWKAIYKRVTGHVGLSKEVEQFFRSSWKPNMIDEAVKAEPGLQPPPANITGEVNGRELQTLRSNLSDLTYRLEGPDKFRAGQLLREIDNAIERANPEIGAVFRDTNRKYAANSTLLELERKNGILQGNISLERLGQITKDLYEQHPLYDLGLAGRQLKLRGMFEGAQLPEGDLTSLLSRGQRFALGTLPVSPIARSLQRRISEVPKE